MKKRAVNCLLCLSLLLSLLPIVSQSAQANQTEDTETLLGEMTPAQKVGQLFLVTFDGTDLSEDSAVYDLINNYHVGGLVLSSERNNFAGEETVKTAWQLINDLQQMNWQKLNSENEESASSQESAYVPLYIGMSLVENDNRTPQIREGLTEYPSPMSIGATWSTDLSKEVGSLVGNEMAALGVNLLLGPSLDVIDSKDLVAAAYANTQSFGGDPYWVGELGKAYIEGIHTGSGGRISVIAQHFPGLGSVDRLPSEEVSTIQKTLEQLKQIELAPYISVVSDPDPLRQVDGLMVSAIRFQGLQGNIRATTMPVNFDQTALEQLLSTTELTAWREAGGLTISDSLGSPAIRSFFSASDTEFDPLSVARTAFLAGNDMLYLDNFRARNDDFEIDTVRRTIEFFTQKYQEDALFAQRVDASVLRILRAKEKIYPEFNLEIVLNPETGLANIGISETVGLKVNREAVTLLYPSAEYLNTILPQPPVLQDKVTIFTDTRLGQQCDTCFESYDFSTMDFEDTLIRYYGRQGTNQLNSDRINSYSLIQLTEILDQRTQPSDPNLADNLQASQWVVFNVLNENASLPASLALKRMLSERLDLLRNKHVIVFSYSEPLYLDSTDLANITAYYALYNKSQAALDIATRVLMREMTAPGALPISLKAIDYQLGQITAPNPNQVINVDLITSIQTEPTDEVQTPIGETPVPLFVMGENVRIQAGPIVDYNGNLVPDGTVVRFTVRLSTESLIISQPEAVTQKGYATIDYRIEREGIFEVTAISEPARTSGTLILNTQGGLAQVILPTATPTPTSTPTIAPTPTATPEPTPTPEAQANLTGYPKLTDWLLVVLFIAMGAFLAWIVGYKWWGGVRWGLRSSLLTAIGGLLAYLLLTVGIKPIVALVKESASWFVVQTTAIGMIFGWAAALTWWVLSQNKPKIEPPNQP